MRGRSIISTMVGSSILGMILAFTPAYGDMMAKDKMTGAHTQGHKAGTFAGIGSHHAAGKVSVGKGENGQAVLTMTDITVDKVPDGRIYLAHNFDYASGVELGKLTTFTGAVTLPIPASVDLVKYDSVVIWCKKFDVGIGQAKLQ